MMRDDESLGGDPACWAHLFEDTGEAEVVDLREIAGAEGAGGLIWASRGEDLNLNLLVFDAGDGVMEHVNHEVEVLIVAVVGEGVVTVDDRELPLRSGQLVLVPKGARRGTRATGDGFSYLTCHRRRGGLLPVVRPPSGEDR
jgi:mannose-6-phosphate isomerase-like protein (cupin superfamily)